MIKTNTEVVLDEITLYVHIEYDGSSRGNFPWEWTVTTTPDLPRWHDGSLQLHHVSVVKWSHAMTRLGAIWAARKWCRRNAARLAGRKIRNRYQRFTYNASWGVD